MKTRTTPKNLTKSRRVRQPTTRRVRLYPKGFLPKVADVPAARPWYSRSFYAELPTAPTNGSRKAAQSFYLKICELLERHTWSHGDRAGLRRLEHRWRRRALGLDARWLAVGSRSGKLADAVRAAFGLK